jgi:hypothetical protein
VETTIMQPYLHRLDRGNIAVRLFAEIDHPIAVTEQHIDGRHVVGRTTEHNINVWRQGHTQAAVLAGSDRGHQLGGDECSAGRELLSLLAFLSHHDAFIGKDLEELNLTNSENTHVNLKNC